jgi:hypothetical protein
MKTTRSRRHLRAATPSQKRSKFPRKREPMVPRCLLGCAWVPAFAGMTVGSAEMTVGSAGMTI